MNQQILSQDEVDALLQGITPEEDTDMPQGADEAGVRGVDFADAAHLVRGRMPTLEVVNERFARNLRSSLMEIMRRSAEVSVGSVKVQKFSAFLREIVVPANFNVVGVRPLRGAGLVICEPSLVFAVIDALFGGAGKFHTRIEGREFSATEMRIIRRLVDTIAVDYAKAWQGIYPLNLEYQRSEMQPQFANIAAPGERVVSTSFTFEIGEASGSLHLCIPYGTLEPIRDLLHADLPGDGAEPDQRWVELLQNQIQGAEVELVAELAQAPATVEQLLSFKPGDFIELDLDPQIQATVDGVPVFDCQYGTANNRYAIRIDRLIARASMDWLGAPQDGR